MRISNIMACQKEELLTDYQTAKGTQGSLFHVNHLMNVEEEPLHSGKLPPREPGAITFQNVTFSYSTEHPILKNVSFTIHANQKTAIIGENGCGKSTILKLIQGFYQADSGTIAIDESIQADHIIVMAEGAVEACGTLEEIKARSETFRSFAGAQGKEKPQ